jgi:hypothetical protein
MGSKDEHPAEISGPGMEARTGSYVFPGGNTYGFSFERQLDGNIRIYIVSQPSYGSREADPHITHRIRDGNRNYINWVRNLYTMEEAKQVAAGWARRTERFITTGQPF